MCTKQMEYLQSLLRNRVRVHFARHLKACNVAICDKSCGQTHKRVATTANAEA